MVYHEILYQMEDDAVAVDGYVAAVDTFITAQDEVYEIQVSLSLLCITYHSPLPPLHTVPIFWIAHHSNQPISVMGCT